MIIYIISLMIGLSHCSCLSMRFAFSTLRKSQNKHT